MSDFRYIGCPYGNLASVLLEPSGAWLAALAESWNEGPGAPSTESLPGSDTLDGKSEKSVIARVGIGPQRSRPQVRLSFGRPRERQREVVLPLVWEPRHLGFLIPSMDADLTVAMVDAGSSRLGLMGRYHPPLAAAGGRTDHLCLHRVAESSVRNFLEEVELALLQRAQAGLVAGEPSVSKLRDAKRKAAPP